MVKKRIKTLGIGFDEVMQDGFVACDQMNAQGQAHTLLLTFRTVSAYRQPHGPFEPLV